MFELPFEPTYFGMRWNVHLILEYLAFIIGFRYYVYLRKRTNDPISYSNRLSIILGAVFGALLGSRIMGWLEYPFLDTSQNLWLLLLNTKTIMGGLFGGLLGVEIAKKCIGETRSSGDLFTFPIILGIFIGRIGCFLSGTNEFTYGTATRSVLGMDLGDGILRHPVALYELGFLLLFFIFLKRLRKRESLPSGHIFKYFMIAYFTFRFFIEFIKPNEFLILGLSSIQYLSIVCLIYYRKTILSIKNNTSHAG